MRQTACLRCGSPMVSRCPNGCPPVRSNRDPMYDTPDWRRLRKAELAKHVARYGWWCPGFGVSAHPSHDLTLDHIEPGTLRLGTQVLCRSCNTRKRHADARR